MSPTRRLAPSQAAPNQLTGLQPVEPIEAGFGNFLVQMFLQGLKLLPRTGAPKRIPRLQGPKNAGRSRRQIEAARKAAEAIAEEERRQERSPRQRPGQATSSLDVFELEILGVLDTKADSVGVVSRSETGPITIFWGKPGDPKTKFKKGGFGLSHIIARRDVDFADGKIKMSGEEFVRSRLPKVLAQGKMQFTRQGRDLRAEIRLGDDVAVLGLFFERRRHTWLLTAFESSNGE